MKTKSEILEELKTLQVQNEKLKETSTNLEKNVNELYEQLARANDHLNLLNNYNNTERRRFEDEFLLKLINYYEKLVYENKESEHFKNFLSTFNLQEIDYKDPQQYMQIGAKGEELVIIQRGFTREGKLFRYGKITYR